MGEIVEADRDNFWDVVEEGTVLADFWGPDCEPCKALEPEVERMAEERPELRVAKVEAPNARRRPLRHRVLRLNGVRGNGPGKPGEDQGAR
jgi:thioredoxin 1